MEEVYWFAVRMDYVCNQCNCSGTEKMVVASPHPDHTLIMERINKEKLSCSSCKALLAGGTPVNVSLQAGTLEQIRQWGYPTPADN